MICNCATKGSPVRAFGSRGFSEKRQPVLNILPLKIGPKDLETLDSPDDQIVKCAQRIYPRFAWHGPSKTRRHSISKA
jgi:hypothetical protein